MKEGDLTPEQTADRLEVTLKTLKQWRWRGKGPRYRKVGRTITYALNDIEEFEDAQLRLSTSCSVSYPVSP